MQGHDKNDDVVGTVYYNNQSNNSVHIASIYVHGKNITTQGRISINQDIEVSEKKKLVDIMREKLGETATVSVDVHYND
jgi:aerobic-type carbon monoxide dehydrogenase small subunit (CoxS/CutS family)